MASLQNQNDSYIFEWGRIDLEPSYGNLEPSPTLFVENLRASSSAKLETLHMLRVDDIIHTTTINKQIDRLT